MVPHSFAFKPDQCLPDLVAHAMSVTPEIIACPSASYLTDLNETYWQSDTMFEGIQWPYRVNLTLHLKKSFEITYVRLKFQSPRPESFAIYRRMSEDGPWLPYQYYSASCRGFYLVPDMNYVHGGDETRALCTSEFSDISPLTGGEVAFSTLEGRPSAYNFDNSKELQDWVTVTDIRITLDRLNTFGDEVFGDEKVLRSYFYAISDFAVGARCKCNGHASECVDSSSERGDRRQVCRCEHNTAGADCDQCLPFYNDKPWRSAGLNDANECQPCNCNGFSDRCFFDQKLYESTGHGGHCTDCSGNRDGPNCERCKDNFYQRSDGYCIPCFCDETGSRSLQCNSEGECQCKPGVTGDKCDRCQANYYDFSPQGCKPCSCSVPGSFRNEPNCDSVTGLCHCKENVEGQQCSNCKPGYFNLDMENDFGCTPCFCYGHAAVCQSAPKYGQVLLESMFARGNERWAAEEYGRTVPLQYNAFTQNIGVTAPGRAPVFFVAPDRFLGDQRGSYNQELNFTLRIGEHGPKASADDIVLEGNGLRVSHPIFGSRNTLPTIQSQEYSFRLHEHPDFGWNPRLNSRDFMKILANLTSIRIRGTFTPNGVGFLDNVKLKTARRGAAGSAASWIEMCSCPEGYIGQFCESCAPGYTHEPKNGGPFARCVPCACYGHADICDPESGQCICQHNTAGDNCERCARGFYGNSLQGTEEDCKPCPCPNQGACIQLQDEQIVCLECPTGYAGPQCEFCGDGYYGDPSGAVGPVTECKICDCNENIDPNAVGNCNRTTGDCLKCIYNSAGAKCEKCLPGFYGDALFVPKGDCKHCECDRLGTIPTADGSYVCEQPTGECPCKENVIGRQCNMCQDGFYDLASGLGCKECDCDPIGSDNATCDVRTGQCHCREGVVGLRCNECAPNHYGFSTEGCKPCDCDPIGSLGLQCSPDGQCPCRENVEGRACERCKENKHNRQAGCVDCSACYNLVQEAVNAQRLKLDEMEKLLEDIANTPTVIDDRDFERKLTQVKDRVDQLWTDAKSAIGGDDKSLLEKVNELKDRVKALDQTAKQIRQSLQKCDASAEECNTNLNTAEETLGRANEALKAAQRFLDSDGKEALEKAQEKSEEHGQQRNLMSELARQARLLAEEHEEEAQKMEKIGAAAVNTSNEAYKVAWDSLGQQRNASAEAQALQHSIQEIENEVKSTRVRAENALEAAKAAYNNALDMFKDATSLSLPTIDLKSIKEQAQEAKKQAESLKQTVSSLLQEREQLLKDAEEESKQARKLHDTAKKNQQMADELMADLDKAKASAEEARVQSENTLSEARKIYDTLQDFNRNVDESRDSAAEAKQRIPEIQMLIRDAENRTKNNQMALSGAKVAASTALSDAETAQSIAEKASEEADVIRGECEETKNRAGNVMDEAGQLAGRVADTEAKLLQTEKKIGEEDAEVKTALDKASEAQSLSREAYDKVQRALATIRDVDLSLQNLDQINDEGLETLSRKINDVERELEDADLDSKIDALRNARNRQTLWLKNYEDELDALRKEVDNVQDIRNALPPDTRCWKRTRLEP
ncbi:Laminin subunit gamma-1 [Orchesella cincta]|uniref:Laminin subunit gamma-1 n=1 Tax=Orchesella cincta TaxID=48709 RepID=A0A1D2NJE1_ORCCI|nr:Laminin subunit gamma-1 [Orchesella cincta]